MIDYLANKGNNVFVVAPIERRYKSCTSIINEGNIKILNVLTPNIQKTTLIEKGFSTLLIEPLFSYAIVKYFPKVKFDLVLYSTPPITFTSIITKIAQCHGATTYLLLKRYFPTKCC